MRTRRQALGQHFLKDRSVVTKIVALAETLARQHGADAILEVGPGQRAISNDLAALASNLSVPLFLVERDRYLLPHLSDGWIGEPELTFLDAASEGFPKFLRALRERGFKKVLFVSNLPYSASSQILAHLCHESAGLCGAVIMVQKELAQRMTAPAGGKHRGAFSFLIESYFRAGKGFDVSPGAFSPPPQVMSTVLPLEPWHESPVRQVADFEGFERFCKGLFGGRRKMIRNLLPPAAKEAMGRLGLTGEERPETLTLETALALYAAGDKV